MIPLPLAVYAVTCKPTPDKNPRLLATILMLTALTSTMNNGAGK